MSEDRERVAACACGALRVTARGDPDVVVACSCIACQRRTGSPFGVGAYFRNASIVSIDGAPSTYTRTADSGRTFTTNFCPDCGTSVFWTLEMRPEHVGIAVGCFADPNFPRPVRAVWAENCHHWIRYPDDLPVFDKAAR